MKTRLKLGLDVRIFSQPMSGVARYAVALLQGLRCRDMFDIVLFTDTPLREEYSSIVQGLPLVSCPTSDRKEWRRKILPRQLKENKIQVYHAIWDKGVPLGRPCPVVMTIYDLFCISWKNKYLSLFKKFNRWLDLRREVGDCEKVMTISQFSARNIIRDLGVSAAKVAVTLLDCDRKNIDAVLSRPLNPLRYQELAGGGDYFLSIVGRVNDKRKNVPFLIKSYAKFLSKNVASRKIRLLIAGHYDSQGEAYLNLMKIIRRENLEQQVVFLGHLPDDELYWVLKRSKAMVFTSLFEGFGIPVIEAFYLGVPVIAGNSCAMAEIAEDGAAILVDPADEDALARAMTKVAFVAGEAERLIEKGLSRSKIFDWGTAVDKIILTYEDAWRNAGCSRRAYSSRR